ncbi:MAG: DUF2169 domain-containing protein, partial [Chitinophagaceae bacterium]
MIQDLPSFIESEQAKPAEVIQLSGTDSQGSHFLSVLVKQSYHLLPDGKCEKAGLPIPLRLDFQFNGENEEILNADTDLYLDKPFTDLVIKGHGRTGGSGNQSRITVEVSNQKGKLDLSIFGKRFAYKDQYSK